jgi:hypothetical protein
MRLRLPNDSGLLIDFFRLVDLFLCLIAALLERSRKCRETGVLRQKDDYQKHAKQFQSELQHSATIMNNIERKEQVEPIFPADAV